MKRNKLEIYHAARQPCERSAIHLITTVEHDVIRTAFHRPFENLFTTF